MGEALYLIGSRQRPDVAEAVAHDLGLLGLGFSIDHGIPEPGPWWDVMVSDLEAAEAVLYLLTTEADRDEMCIALLDYAYRRRSRIIPVVFDSIHDTLLHDALRQKQQIDYTDRDVGLRQLARALNSVSESSDVEMPNKQAMRPEPPSWVRTLDVDLLDTETRVLEPAEQRSIVTSLRELHARGYGAADLDPLITLLADGNPLTVDVSERIDDLRSELHARRNAGEAWPASRHGAALPQESPKRVFISYARAAADFVHDVANDLRGIGYEVWLDRELTGGRDWWSDILHQIRHADAIICIRSPDLLSSRACTEEIAYALECQRPVVSLSQHDDAQPTDWNLAGELHDYSPARAASVAELARALWGLNPDPVTQIPDDPPAPSIGAFEVRRQLAGDLSIADQEKLLTEVKNLTSLGVDSTSLAALVGEFTSHKDVLVHVREELESWESWSEIVSDDEPESSADSADGRAKDKTRLTPKQLKSYVKAGARVDHDIEGDISNEDFSITIKLDGVRHVLDVRNTASKTRARLNGAKPDEKWEEDLVVGTGGMRRYEWDYFEFQGRQVYFEIEFRLSRFERRVEHLVLRLIIDDSTRAKLLHF